MGHNTTSSSMRGTPAPSGLLLGRVVCVRCTGLGLPVGICGRREVQENGVGWSLVGFVQASLTCSSPELPQTFSPPGKKLPRSRPKALSSLSPPKGPELVPVQSTPLHSPPSPLTQKFTRGKSGKGKNRWPGEKMVRATTSTEIDAPFPPFSQGDIVTKWDQNVQF
jgi:hypothetical protein